MGDADDLREAYGRFIAALEANDADALAAIVSPDIVDHDALPGQAPGREGVVRWMRGMHAGLSDLSGVVEDTVVEGDKIASRITWRGTHVGSFLGLPATGKSVSLGSMHLLRFENGLATDWWGVPDLYGALTRLGATFELPPA
ncbi:ester cyclase [Cryobacterium tepidiphilum]|uniref:Ester cyclase n=1 Tax=Cryobacterium tepidiphilum TaxID=2486026 RepID=A0A3M8L1J0_9MICO|nr:ester cyclase [Cryobacterium tepidiphilum]RNE59135.1 ester cyclase [Cryobacterium tepidiphilum]